MCDFVIVLIFFKKIIFITKKEFYIIENLIFNCISVMNVVFIAVACAMLSKRGLYILFWMCSGFHLTNQIWSDCLKHMIYSTLCFCLFLIVSCHWFGLSHFWSYNFAGNSCQSSPHLVYIHWIFWRVELPICLRCSSLGNLVELVVGNSQVICIAK